MTSEPARRVNQSLGIRFNPATNWNFCTAPPCERRGANQPLGIWLTGDQFEEVSGPLLAARSINPQPWAKQGINRYLRFRLSAPSICVALSFRFFCPCAFGTA
jgi:hypothetical protein